MNQSELILKTAQISGVSKKDVEHVLKTAGDVVGAALVEEGEAPRRQGADAMTYAEFLEYAEIAIYLVVLAYVAVDLAVSRLENKGAPQ